MGRPSCNGLVAMAWLGQLSFRSLFKRGQVSDQIAALLGVFNSKTHALPGNQVFRVAQPREQRLRCPAQARRGQLCRIFVACQATNAPPQYAAVSGANFAGVHAVAGGALALVQRCAPNCIARRRAKPLPGGRGRGSTGGGGGGAGESNSCWRRDSGSGRRRSHSIRILCLRVCNLS